MQHIVVLLQLKVEAWPGPPVLKPCPLLAEGLELLLVMAEEECVEQKASRRSF